MTHLQKLKSKLGAGAPDAVIVSSEINQFYISGFSFSDGYLLVTRGKSYLITDFRYTEAAQNVADKELIVATPSGGMLNFIANKLTENKCRTVALEESTLSISSYEKMKTTMPGIEFIPTASKLIEGLREIKDEHEQNKIAAAQGITDAAFTHILNFLKPDMTEYEVAFELDFFMRKHGATPAFETIVVSGTASSMPHGTPRAKKLERGFLTMDFGAKLDGYCSDMTRTVVLGRADAKMNKLYNTVLHAQLSALKSIKEGANQREVDKVARDIIEGSGYEGCFGHGTGHGVGMYIHEAPRLSPAAPEGACLRAGQVVTVEPGIYISGKYGCRIEDMVCVTKSGMINFTHSTKELIELF